MVLALLYQLTRAKFSVIMQSFPRHAMRAKLIKRGFRSEDFELWKADHDCIGGYEGSSQNMEAEYAKILWNRSEDHGLE